jgi:glycosyltransferase involved in cell wall biosynthesis
MTEISLAFPRDSAFAWSSRLTPANAPDIDVLLVCYMHERYIEKAIDSILYQEYPGKIRVVVADDSSSDATVSIIKEIAARQFRIEFLFLEGTGNIGITPNYERGFAACTSKYVAVLEGDDYWASTQKIHKQVQFLEEHRECVACACNYYIHNAERMTYDLRVQKTDGFMMVTARSLIADNLIGNFSTCVYRRDVLQALPQKLFTMVAYDWAVNICAAMHGVIGFICEPLSVYRIHEQGAYNNLSLRQKIEGQINLIPKYDELTSRMFNKEFSELQVRLAAHPIITAKFFASERSRQLVRRALRFCPPVIVRLMQLLLPPAILYRL